MNTLSRTITGVVSVVIGIAIATTALTQSPAMADSLIGGATGLFFIGVGAYVFFNTSEDSIEEVDTDNE